MICQSNILFYCDQQKSNSTVSYTGSWLIGPWAVVDFRMVQEQVLHSLEASALEGTLTVEKRQEIAAAAIGTLLARPHAGRTLL